MLKTMQYDFTHCFNHWKMHGWIKGEIVLKLSQVTNGSWIEIHQIHEAWNWSLNQKVTKIIYYKELLQQGRNSLCVWSCWMICASTCLFVPCSKFDQEHHVKS